MAKIVTSEKRMYKIYNCRERFQQIESHLSTKGENEKKILYPNLTHVQVAVFSLCLFYTPESGVYQSFFKNHNDTARIPSNNKE